MDKRQKRNYRMMLDLFLFFLVCTILGAILGIVTVYFVDAYIMRILYI